jgi:hypothetical protein
LTLAHIDRHNGIAKPQGALLPPPKHRKAMDYDAWQTLTAMFFDRAAALGERPFLWVRREGSRSACWPGR